jgi:hypothetical protein
MSEEFLIISGAFAGLCAVTVAATAMYLFTVDVSPAAVPTAAASIRSTPASSGAEVPSIAQPSPGELPTEAQRLAIETWWSERQMEQWWNFTHQTKAKPVEARKRENRSLSASQKTWGPEIPAPQRPRYLSDTTNWPLHGPD